jgi:hypothetical protein
MSKLTADQWKRIEASLRNPWGEVKLRVDGYDLTLQVRQVKPLRYAIVPFVNGFNRGVWLTKKKGEEWCEEARRFLPLKKLYLYSKTKLMKTKLPKKTRDEWASKHIEIRGMYWTSFAALKRHLIANNQSIELAGEKPA